MGRCETCRWWGQRNHIYGDDENGHLRSCGAPAIRYGYCVRVEDVAADGALVEDDEGWGMYTGPHFGCVQWAG